MKVIISSHKAWAINANSKEGHGLLGKYWWFENRSHIIPVFLNGYTTACFRTRKEAREALKSAKRAFPKARVERIIVEIMKELK